MSPVGGVGINLAVQDAVAAANILAEPLRAGAVTAAHLAAVQAPRELPMRAIQWLQVHVQNQLLSPALTRTSSLHPHLSRSHCCNGSRCFAAFRRGSSVSASGPSTSRRRNVPRARSINIESAHQTPLVCGNDWRMFPHKAIML